MTTAHPTAKANPERWLSPATAYASNADVDFTRSAEAVRLGNGRHAWPSNKVGFWILRWNDRHGDLWNAWMPEGWVPGMKAPAKTQLPAANDALAKAVDSLGAICVRSGIIETIIGGDGKGPDVTRVVRPALYALTWGKLWYITDAEGVRLTHLLGGGEMIAHTPTVMPSWWSPERRKGLRHKTCGYVETGLLTAVCEGCRQPTAVSCERLTASLETGAEVAA